MEFSEIVERLKNNESRYGEIDVNDEYYKWIPVTLTNTVATTLSDCHRLFKSEIGSKTKINCYLTAIAIYEYIPPYPDYLNVEQINMTTTQREFNRRKRWYGEAMQTDRFISGPKYNISVFNKPLGSLSNYPFPNSFLMNISLAGLFSDLDNLPHVYRQNNLDLYDELGTIFERYSEVTDTSDYDMIVDYLEKMKNRDMFPTNWRSLIPVLARSTGVNKDDINNILEDLVREGRIKVENMDLWYLG